MTEPSTEHSPAVQRTHSGTMLAVEAGDPIQV